MATAPLRILLVGSLSPAISGTAILVQQLANDLGARDDVRVATVDTGGIRFGGLRAAGRFLGVVRRMFVEAGRADVVSLHINRTALALIGPVAWLISRLRRRPLIIRLFGGAAHTALHGISRAVGWWVISHADLYLVETRDRVRATQEEGMPRVQWYSNSRPMPRAQDNAPLRRRCRKFVSLGRLYREKGIAEMVAAAARFGDDVSVDVYGPFWFGTASESDFAGQRGIRYCGSVDPGKVPETLRRYDALLLPTYDSTEGYPGIVLEAYAAGLPVICSRIGGLPEIVDDTSGLLIPPRDANALFEAMRKLVEDDGLYQHLQEGVRSKRLEFSSDAWAERFMALCREVLDRRGVTCA